MSVLVGPVTVSPPFKVIKISTGLGKSRAALRRVKKLARSGEQVIYVTKTVALADELARRVGSGIKVRVWRGRERDNPDQPGETMCRQLDLVDEALSVFADPTEVVCPICPHRASCAYLAQREATASIWFGASELLWHEMPAAMKGASLLVIDEAFALSGLQGLEGHPILIGINDLMSLPATRSVALEADLVVDLMPLRKKLIVALADQPLGWLSREPLIAAGLTAIGCVKARKVEWRAKVEIKVTPTTTFMGLRKKFDAAKDNRAVWRRAMLWRAIEGLLEDRGAEKSGRIEIVEQIDKNAGVTYRALRLYGARPIAKGWAELPTLHLDATGNIELIRARVPHAELCADIAAEEPHVRVIQYPSHTFSKSALTADTNFLAKTWYSAVAHAQHVDGNWLIVMQKDAEARVRKWLGETGRSIPSFIEVGHHNALAGIDRYRDVRGVVVIGRTLPAPVDIERIAGVLTGRAVPSCGSWYPTELVTLAAADGSMMTAERVVHPDPLAEAIRQQICEDELMQLIGRGRGPNRSAANPLEVVIYGNLVLPVPLEELRVWLPPSVDDELLAGTGLTLSSSGDLAEAFGLNADNIRQRRHREKRQTVTVAYRDFLYGDVTACRFSANALRAGTYRRAKVKHGTRRVIYDPRTVPDIEARLVEHFGPLAEFHLVPAAADTADTVDDVGTVPPHQDQGQVLLPPTLDETMGPQAPEARSGPTSSAAVSVTMVAHPPAYAQPAQLDLFGDDRLATAHDPLPAWPGGIAPPPIRQAILHELWRRGKRHSDLATAVGLSRPQITNLLRGRFGTGPATADALRLLLDGWRAA